MRFPFGPWEERDGSIPHTSVIRSFINEFTPQYGKEGGRLEYKVATLFATSRGVKVYTNVIMYTIGAPTSTEIDVIVIGRSCLLCVECKAYHGNIYGRVGANTWFQYLGRGKRSFYNPLMQNRTHCKVLRQVLIERGVNIDAIPICSLVVFADDANIEKLQLETCGRWERVCRYRDVVPAMNELVGNCHTRISETLAQGIATVVSSFKKGSTIDRRVEHSASVKERFESNICPVCGNTLQLRTGKHGDFYGCASYPKCRYTRGVQG